MKWKKSSQIESGNELNDNDDRRNMKQKERERTVSGDELNTDDKRSMKRKERGCMVSRDELNNRRKENV
ncbi:hypothetical protein RclHR1_17070010 [Rhizophagus clarus]|nr:hypothetical protein RclHR1_17070010 [Rhizophagus clarus]